MRITFLDTAWEFPAIRSLYEKNKNKTKRNKSDWKSWKSMQNMEEPLILSIAGLQVPFCSSVPMAVPHAGQAK